MKSNRETKRKSLGHRRGTAMIVVVLCLVPLVGFVALSVDVGLLATARTQCQDAADGAALAGARTLNGDFAGGNNYSLVDSTARDTTSTKSILSSTLTAGQVNVEIGRYSYNTTNQRFEGQFPGPSSDNWTMVRATITADVNNRMGFSKVFGGTIPNVTATSTAVHRPRDVAIILDYSGSMRFASLAATPTSGTRTASNNGDSVVPTFGHYSSSSAGLVQSSFTTPYIEANITHMTSDGRAPIVQDFYQDSSGTTAFTAQTSAYGTTPGGDNFLKQNKNTGASFAATPAELMNISAGSVSNSTRDATFETSGYTAYSMASTFNGYTLGPGYWGKTFWVWPPDPRSTCDWRKLYFTYPGSSTPMDDNSLLWNSSGNWRAPSSSTYAINYTAILAWIKSGTNPFPNQLRSGRIQYYSAIPDTIDTSTFPPTNVNQRFWKEYIDYCLGLCQTGSSSWTVFGGSSGISGYGADFTWGTIRVTAKSSLSGSPKPYMHYNDNPKRPKTNFWFGPLSMVDFLGNYNAWGQVSPYGSRYAWWPGTCHESPMYGCKLGIRAALTDMSNNHPNDLASMIMFSVPAIDAANSGAGRFNRVRVGLSRDFSTMNEYLWYPPSTVGNSSATVTPYDSNNLEAPRAYGGTCYSMPLMLAFNQFSGNSSLKTFNPGAPSGDAGGNGRRGAQKIIIFETDGAPNTSGTATFVNNGAHQSYYRVRYNSSSPGSSDFPTGIGGYPDNDTVVVNEISAVCTKLAALESAGGYSTASKPLLIHCIGFGPEFDPSGPHYTVNKATLNTMQTIGSVTDNMPSYKTVYGSEATVIANLQQAFTQILQSGVQVSLIH